MAMRTHLLVACVAAGILALPFPVQASGPAAVSSKGSFLSVDIDNSPPGELLGAMAKERLIEIKGAIPAGATLTLHSSDLTLEQVLGKIMRGYNYVLVEQGKTRPPLLTILGRIQRGPAEAPKSGRSPSSGGHSSAEILCASAASFRPHREGWKAPSPLG